MQDTGPSHSWPKSGGVQRWFKFTFAFFLLSYAKSSFGHSPGPGPLFVHLIKIFPFSSCLFTNLAFVKKNMNLDYFYFLDTIGRISFETLGMHAPHITCADSINSALKLKFHGGPLTLIFLPDTHCGYTSCQVNDLSDNHGCLCQLNGGNN